MELLIAWIMEGRAGSMVNAYESGGSQRGLVMHNDYTLGA